MKSKLNFKSGNNVPIHSPLIPDPFVPYNVPDNPVLTAICRIDADIIKKFLEPTPFEYVDNKFIISIADASNCDKGGFLDASIIVPARYKNIVGGHYLFEYESEDFAIAAGRELWGYPKKFAEIKLLKTKDKVTGSAFIRGKEVIKLEFDLNSTLSKSLPKINLTPHLSLHTVPNSDKPGIYSQRIIERDVSPDCKIKSVQEGNIKVTLNGDDRDPLHVLTSLEVIGGTFMIQDFHATEENGWGQIVDIIK